MNDKHDTKDRIQTMTLAAVTLLAMAWLLTHDGCAHPIGNAIAAIVYAAAGTMLVLPHAIAWIERNTQGQGEGER